MTQQVVTTSESYFLYCCSTPYSIIFPEDYQLSQSKKYYLLIGVPDKAPEYIPVEVSGTNKLLVKESPKLDYPHKVHVSVQDDCNEKVAEFCLDLLSPVDYLFRKLSLESNAPEEKMSSAILAMSLSYYLVMEEQVGKNSKMDEILSSLLSSSKDIYKTVIMSLQGASNGEQIKKFCERHHLNLLLQEVKKAQIEDFVQDEHGYEVLTHPPTRKASAEYDYVDFEHTGSIPAPPSQGPKSPPPRPPLPDAIYRNMQTSPNVTDEDPYIAMHPHQKTSTFNQRPTSSVSGSPAVPPRRQKPHERPRSVDSLLLHQLERNNSSNLPESPLLASPQPPRRKDKSIHHSLKKPERPPRPQSLESGLECIGRPRTPKKNLLSNLIGRQRRDRTDN